MRESVSVVSRPKFVVVSYRDPRSLTRQDRSGPSQQVLCSHREETPGPPSLAHEMTEVEM